MLSKRLIIKAFIYMNEVFVYRNMQIELNINIIIISNGYSLSMHSWYSRALLWVIRC